MPLKFGQSTIIPVMGVPQKLAFLFSSPRGFCCQRAFVPHTQPSHKTLNNYIDILLLALESENSIMLQSEFWNDILMADFSWSPLHDD